MELTELVTSEKDGVLTAWCWWEILGTLMKGSGLIKVTDNGVISERLANYTKLSEWVRSLTALQLIQHRG